ncbi:MAG: hypothetical protein ACE5Q9_05920 [Nitrosopumilus sp.]
MNPHLKSNQTIQQVIDGELERCDVLSDVKYQDITYYMQNPNKVVKSKDNISIDFLKATSEMNDLDWNYEWNYIGFSNNKKLECVQFIRQGEEKWYAEVPINNGKGWDGYAWCGYSEIETITNMLRLFFEEVPWFGMLSWKMRRFKH